MLSTIVEEKRKCKKITRKVYTVEKTTGKKIASRVIYEIVYWSIFLAVSISLAAVILIGISTQ